MELFIIGPGRGLLTVRVSFWPWAQKCSEWASWGASWNLFWVASVPEARNAQNEFPEAYSGQVLRQTPEMLKMSLLRLILCRFCAWGQKYSKWPWGLFWPGSGTQATRGSKLRWGQGCVYVKSKDLQFSREKDIFKPAKTQKMLSKRAPAHKFTNIVCFQTENMH